MICTALHSCLFIGIFSTTANAAQPMVELTKTCPNLRYLGRDATCEIMVTNRGDAAAQNVTVRDVITGGVQILNIDNNGVREGNTIVWRLGTLEAGQAHTLKVKVRCNQIGRVTNRATVSYCAEAAAGCEFEIKGIPAILLECVDDPDPIELNGTVTYTITVTNQGTAVDTNILINVTLPVEEEYITSTGPTQASVAGQEVSFAPLASLAAKAKAVYTLRVKGVATGDVRFRVELNSDQLTAPVMETESTHIYE